MTFMWLRELPSWITAFEDFQGCITWTILRLNFIYCLKNPRCCLQLYPHVLISQSSNCYLSQSFANMSSGSAKIGQPAPDFTGKAVVNRQFKDLKLSDYKGKGLLLCSCGKVDLHLQITANLISYRLFCAGKYVVFFFYPLDFTFVCPTEIVAFSDRVEDFRNINCEVIGCSIDSHFTHLAWWEIMHSERKLCWV